MRGDSDITKGGFTLTGERCGAAIILRSIRAFDPSTSVARIRLGCGSDASDVQSTLLPFACHGFV